jgi:hypothetical protein
MRSAESNRISTCPFADKISSTSIGEYHRLKPEYVDLKQTVLSTIVLHNSLLSSNDSFKVKSNNHFFQEKI